MSAQPSTGRDEAWPARWVYILYLASLVFAVTALIGIVIAYVNQEDAPDWLGTHYRFQIRTFWIGLAILVPGMLTLSIGIGVLVLLFGAIWLIVRCARGMKHLSRGAAHPDPQSWTFG